MKRLGFVLLILLLGISVNRSMACPKGGEITWTCVGQDSFLIKLVVYTDCNAMALSSSPITFRCISSGSSITSLNIAVGTAIDITPVCNVTCSRCTSLSCSFPFGINKYTLLGIVRLNSAGSCCNISMSWGYTSRGYEITTGTGGYPFYIDAKLNRCQNPCDNSPVFTNTPIPVLCNGQDFTFNYGALDVDVNSTGSLSDSLTYEWAAPLQAAGSVIPYSGQYAYNKPIYFYGFPDVTLPAPRGLRLDPRTGDMQFRPMKTEATTMVIQVNEFRNGVKIGEIRRDMTIYVINCTSNSPPTVTTPNNVRVKNICLGDSVSLIFSTSDVNSNDSVYISWNNAIPGATWTHNNGQTKRPSATFSWTPSASQISSKPYIFTVTARDNACPMTAQFTQSYQIYVSPSASASIMTYDSGCGKQLFRAVLLSGSSPTYKWSSSAFIFKPDTGPYVTHSFVPGYYPIKLEMTTPACSKSYYDTIFIDTIMSVHLPPDTTVCINSTILLQAKLANVTGPYSLQWGTKNNMTFNGDTTASRLLTVTQDTIINIRATYGSFNCPFDEIKIKVHKNKISLTKDTFYCDVNHVITARFFTNKDVFRSFSWYQDSASAVVDSDADLNVFDSGLFRCVATDTFGCLCTDSIRIHLNPPVIAYAPDSSICFGKNVSIIADSVPGHQYNYQWWLNKSIQSTTKQLDVSPADTTQYSLFTTEFLNGIYCSDTHTITINVKPLPVLSFEKFDNACAHGTQINLDHFVKVNGQKVTNGTWTSPDEPSQVAGNIFFSQSAYANLNPGYKLVYDYTYNNTGCSNSDTVYLLVYPQPPTPGITINGDTIFCNGYSVSLAAAATATHYGWNTGDTVKQITITTSGIFKLAVTENNGCISDSSIPVKVVVNPKPPTPVITLSPSDSFLECNLIDGFYEWYFRPDTLSSPTIINNSTKKIDPKSYCNDCYFNIFFTDTNGCISNSSTYYYFHNNSIDHNYLLSSLKFYPNPAHSLLFAEYSGIEPAMLILTNILGNTILQTKIIPGKNEISLQNYKPGIYFIFLDGRIAGKIIIE